jgi:catechol 2,3-dioxygenase-like lactoylglutathione lyase family enzyme
MARTSFAPAIFRILLPAKDLRKAKQFYESLLGVRGRTVAEGRVYFDCGPVILGVLDYARIPERNRPKPTESVYLSTRRLDLVFRRARRLRCLAKGLLHGDTASPLGKPVVRPWGERSFYIEDPSGNSLCFVERGTEFTGTAAQISALRRAS